MLCCSCVRACVPSGLSKLHFFTRGTISVGRKRASIPVAPYLRYTRGRQTRTYVRGLLKDSFFLFLVCYDWFFQPKTKSGRRLKGQQQRSLRGKIRNLFLPPHPPSVCCSIPRRYQSFLPRTHYLFFRVCFTSLMRIKTFGSALTL